MEAPYIKFLIDIQDKFRYPLHRDIRDTGYLGPIAEIPVKIESEEKDMYYADQGWLTLEGMVENTVDGWITLGKITKMLKRRTDGNLADKGVFAFYEWPRPEGNAASIIFYGD